MNLRNLGRWASNIGTTLLVACAVVMTTLIVRRELASGAAKGTRATPANEMVSQPDWATYAIGNGRIGHPNALVTIVEFTDYQCPACRTAETRLKAARQRFGDTLAVVYRHFPIESRHPFAAAAALASECAARQGQFERMHTLLFERRDSVGRIPWSELGKRAGVSDVRVFERCLTDSSAKAVVLRDRADADRLQIRGTPSFLVDGVRFTGVPSQTVIDSLIASAIRKRLGQ